MARDLNEDKFEKFSFSDAWIFVSLRGSLNDNNLVSFPKLLMTADYMNRAIPTHTEIRNAFEKFYVYGFVEVNETEILINQVVDELYELVAKKRGGLFSVAENAKTVLNSKRNKLEPIRNRNLDFQFITQNFIENAYKVYVN
ncbi:MAG: hypothetical protein RLN81_13800 [Balneolaceae bacterium]